MFYKLYISTKTLNNTTEPHDVLLHDVLSQNVSKDIKMKSD